MSVQPRYPTPLAPASDGRRLEHVVAVGAAYCSIAAKNAKTAATDTWVEYEDDVVVSEKQRVRRNAKVSEKQLFKRWDGGAGQSNDTYTQEDLDKYDFYPFRAPGMERWARQWRPFQGVTGKIDWEPSDEFGRGEVRWGVFMHPIFKHWEEVTLGRIYEDRIAEVEKVQTKLIVRVQRVDGEMEKEPRYTINAEIITRVDGVWKSDDDLNAEVLPLVPQKMTSDDTSEEDEETSSSSEQESYNTAEEELSED